MAPVYNAMEGELEITAARETLTLNIPIEGASLITLEDFECRGVPLVAGEPYVTDFYVRIDGFTVPDRITNRLSVPTGVSLPLDGAVTRHSFTNGTNRVMGAASINKMQTVTVHVVAPDGTPAQFTQLVLRIQVYGNQEDRLSCTNLNRPLIRELLQSSAVPRYR